MPKYRTFLIASQFAFHQISHRRFELRYSHIANNEAILRFIKNRTSQEHLFFAIFCLKHAITQTQSQTVKKNSIWPTCCFFFMENNARRREREFRPRLEIGGVRDIDFVNRYRVNRTTAQELVELLGQDLARSERGGKTISPETKVTLMQST